MSGVPSWLVVTPALNEADRLPDLARSLVAQTTQPVGLWVIVDDGSSDGTSECLDPRSLPFPLIVHRRRNAGGLRSGSELLAFRDGVEVGLRELPDAGWVMKMDADLRLEPDLFEQLTAVAAAGVGMIGGNVISGSEREQATHVSGALRAYSREGWGIARDLPAALGWDVLDQVAVRMAGRSVVVVPTARATASRRMGSSAGTLAGRCRLGVASRWSGYHPLYFAAKVVRSACARPFGIGAACVLWGYLRAGPGPFAAPLRAAQRADQVARLRSLLRHPRRQTKTLYLPR